MIQQLGQQLGLPQGVISLAQNALSSANGTQGGPLTINSAVTQLAQQYGLSPFQEGRLMRGAQQSLNDLMTQTTSDLSQTPEARTSSGGRSWLTAIAEALGQTAEKLAAEMDKMGQQLGKGDDSSKASDNLKFGAKSQEFSQFFSAANNVIKQLGEALASGGRK